MNAKSNVPGILSLSAASMALLQTTINSEGKPTSEAPILANAIPTPEVSAKTAHLLLAPVDQDQLNRMYAGHSSHASHASHYSSAGGGYSAPVAPRVPSGGDYVPSSPAPARPASPPYPLSPPVTANSQQVAVPISVTETNDLSVTNTAADKKPMQAADDIQRLKRFAAKGNSDAQYSLGMRYLKGSDGLEKDLKMASMLFEFAALQGDPDAKAKLEELKKAGPPAELEKSAK
jgi:hypothetical protein